MKFFHLYVSVFFILFSDVSYVSPVPATMPTPSVLTIVSRNMMAVFVRNGTFYVSRPLSYSVPIRGHFSRSID